jgi:hypothetical protein
MTTIQLHPGMWREREHVLLEHGALSATLFTYSSGVLAIRVRNAHGELVLLPYQGQQIWSATMDGRALGMRSM